MFYKCSHVFVLVSVKSMLEFIDKAAKVYFSNLIWFIVNLLLDLNVVIVDSNEQK